jgi:multidrug efflux pump subunit AcrA (membrane-fusion protein)
VELQIDNARGELLPGSYAQVYFELPGAIDTLRIPVNAVIFRTQNLQVATVGSDARVHLQSITAGRDFGTEIEVLGGLTEAEAIVVNPPDSLADGQQVRVVQPDSSAPPASPAHRSTPS